MKIKIKGSLLCFRVALTAFKGVGHLLWTNRQKLRPEKGDSV